MTGARVGLCAPMSLFCVQLLVSGTSGWVEPVHAAEYSEDAVKAAYLYRFSGYVDWPAAAESAKTFVIAVVDAPAVARELKRLVPGHRINDRIIEVVEASRIKDAGPSAILFIGGGHANLLRPALSELAAESTLVVTDEERGLEEGATVNFLTLDHRVRFEVSLTAADREHLKISAELLAVAVRVFGQFGRS
jgi:YfiR/HmsC-like